MNRILLTALSLILANAANGGELYKWVDKDGNVHYSDTPVEGAEAVDLPDPATFDGPDVRDREPAASMEEPVETNFYRSFGFISPKEDQVFWATGGQIPVQLALQPALRPGDQVNLYLNGELTGDSPLRGLGHTLEGVYRGAHTVRAVVIDQDGNELAATEPVTFHVKQRSIANPQRRGK